MQSGKIARIQLDSPLPQLDNLFDFTFPADLDLAIGARVEVRFGKSKQRVFGFVIEIVGESDFPGQLSSIESVITNAEILKPEIYDFCKLVAARQAVPVADVLRLAVPARSVAVEKKWLLTDRHPSAPTSTNGFFRAHELVAITQQSAVQAWINRVIELALETIADGKSVIVCVPDYRDQDAVYTELQKELALDSIVRFSSSDKPSIRYGKFLRCLSGGNLVLVGSRSAIYAPVSNLGLIIVWDDGDRSHQEQSSPYIHTREAALIRQNLQSCSIAFLSHSISSEMLRLTQLNYLESREPITKLCKIDTVSSDAQLSGAAWAAIRAALPSGPVLVQVPNKGISASSFCRTCNTRCECRACAGPLKLNQSNQLQCHWCNALSMNFKCSNCGESSIRLGRPGATKTLAEIGRAFPGVRMIESTAESHVERFSFANSIVVATPGAEPIAESGYSGVVILDAGLQLNRDSLRSTEDALRIWLNALAFGRENAIRFISGIDGPIAELIKSNSFREIALREFAHRKELRLPPAVRICSVSASVDLLAKIMDLLSNEPVEILGPVKMKTNQFEPESRLILKFEYSDGAHLANKLREISLSLSAGQSRFSSKSGRAMRPIRIKMDDPEVI